MRFRQDFTSDFEQFDFWGKPLAFARFADGERAICTGTPIQGQDGWSFDGRQNEFARQLVSGGETGDHFRGVIGRGPRWLDRGPSRARAVAGRQ
ncbi:MAG: hypothetical protein ACREHD_26775, partial [Pirellulales bacterium]